MRLDPEYFQQKHLADAALVHRNAERFTSFNKLGVRVDASAFYPSIEEYYGQGDLPFLRVGDVDGFIDVAGAETIPSEICDRYATLERVEPGDVLLTKGGAIDRSGLVTAPAAVSRDLIFLKTAKLGAVGSRFFFAYAQSDFFKRLLLRSSSQTAQPHLTITLVRELPVLTGTPQFRNAIAETIDAAFQAKAAVQASMRQAEDRLEKALGLADWAPSEPLAYTASSKAARYACRLDAQYFMPAKLDVIAALKRMKGAKLGDAFDSIRDMVDLQRDDLGQVRNFDVTHALEPVLDDEHPLSDCKDLGSTKKQMRNGDVAVSRLRAYLKEIAIVETSSTYPTVGSSEFIVLRPKKGGRGVSPATLSVFLRSSPVQVILKWCQDGSQHPRFSESDLLEIPLPDKVGDLSPQIDSLVVEALKARTRARSLLEAAKRAIELAIEDCEGSALAHLKNVGA